MVILQGGLESAMPPPVLFLAPPPFSVLPDFFPCRLVPLFSGNNSYFCIAVYIAGYTASNAIHDIFISEDLFFSPHCCQLKNVFILFWFHFRPPSSQIPLPHTCPPGFKILEPPLHIVLFAMVNVKLNILL